MQKLTKENCGGLDYHRNVIDKNIKKGAFVGSGVIYAPITKRCSRKKTDNKALESLAS